MNIKETTEELSSSFSGGWWNYRLIEKVRSWTDISSKTYTDIFYEIHEVYYNSHGSIIAWSEGPMSIYFEDYSDYKEIKKHLKSAYKNTVLKLENDSLIETNKTLKQISKRR